VTLSTYSCLRSFAHGVTPSNSSRLRRRFLKPSTDRNRECTVGVLSFSSPVRLVLCFAPIAAWSCFSTAWIYSWIFLNSLVAATGAVDPLACWVDVSFSWSTILSSSSMRLSNPFAFFSNAFRVSASYFSCWDAAADLVALWVVVSSYRAFSSALTTLSSRSSTSFSRCPIVCCCSLYRPS
jgi:hypothetical protein